MRQKTISRIRRAFFWMTCGSILALAGLGGLLAIAPIDYSPHQPKFFIAFFFALVFEVGLVAMILSFNCWFNLKLTYRKPKASETPAPQSNPVLYLPEHEPTGDEQYARSAG